jgi:hypothetical protein
LVKVKVLFVGELQVVVDVFGWKFPFGCVVEYHIFMQTHQHCKFWENFVFDQLAFGLVSISAVKVVTLSVLTRWSQVTLKQSKAQKVRICQVIKYCVSKELKLLVIALELVKCLSTSVRQSFQQQ